MQGTSAWDATRLTRRLKESSVPFAFPGAIQARGAGERGGGTGPQGRVAFDEPDDSDGEGGEEVAPESMTALPGGWAVVMLR